MCCGGQSVVVQCSVCEREWRASGECWPAVSEV